MKSMDALMARVPHERIAPEDILAERSRILAEHHLTFENEFDTFRKESGRKDVVAARTGTGERVIVRLGERRPSFLFPNGYAGTHIRLPRIIASGGDRIPFEIEEAIDGTMMIELDRATESTGQLSDATLTKLASAFWEFQSIAAKLPLEPLYSPDSAKKFLGAAGDLVPVEARSTAETNREFFEGQFPSKWKFATDNLILDVEGRVTFIDNVKAGKRFFGYDIGWIIWPPWLHMSAEAYADVDGHLAYLDHVKETFFGNIPADTDHPTDLDRAFNLIVFERLLGSLFDIAQKTKHLASSGLDAGDDDRLQAHQQFLQIMLKKISARLK